MRRALAILTLTSAVFTVPVIAQIGGRPMQMSVARTDGPFNDSFMTGGVNLAATPTGPTNAQLAFRGLNIVEGPNAQVTQAAIYFRFRFVPRPTGIPNAIIEIAADGADANIQNQRFLQAGNLPGGGKGALVTFRARVLQNDGNTPPNETEQQGTITLLLVDSKPGASQRPDPTAQPDSVVIFLNNSPFPFYIGVVRDNGVVREGDIYVHGRFIPSQF
jgi:hypothetical protein